MRTQNVPPELSTKEITLKSLKEEIQLVRKNKTCHNTPLPERIWEQLHVLLMKHPLTECVKELNLTRAQVERELITALQKASSEQSKFSSCHKVAEVSAEPTTVFQEVRVQEEASSSVSGLLSIKNPESIAVEQVASIVIETPDTTPQEPSELPTVGVPDAVKKPTSVHPETTTPLNYKAAKAFSTKTAVVEIKRPDGMLMAISICTDRFEELLSAFFKGCPA